MKFINVTEDGSDLVLSLNIEHILYFYRASNTNPILSEVRLITGEKILVKLTHTDLLDTISKARKEE